MYTLWRTDTREKCGHVYSDGDCFADSEPRSFVNKWDLERDVRHHGYSRITGFDYPVVATRAGDPCPETEDTQ